MAAYIFGALGMIALFFIYQQTERRKLIAAKLCADICWSLHYYCMGAYGGIVTNAVGVFRELVFSQRDRKRWASCRAVPIFFIIVNWIIGALTFMSPINIMPIAASTLVTISLWLREPRLTKIISIPVSLTFFVYDMIIGSYIGMLNEGVAIISIIINCIKGRKPTNEE